MHVLQVPPPATGCLGGNGARWRSYRVLGAESPCTCTWCVVRGFLVLVLVLMRLQVHVGWRDKVGTWFLAWVFVIGLWGCIFVGGWGWRVLPRWVMLSYSDYTGWVVSRLGGT